MSKFEYRECVSPDKYACRIYQMASHAASRHGATSHACLVFLTELQHRNEHAFHVCCYDIATDIMGG